MLRCSLVFATLLLLPAFTHAAEPNAKQGNAAIRAAVEKFIDAQEISGAVTLVVDKDKVLALDTIGLADIATDKPMRADTLFWIASMTKPFTAVSILMLQDEGKLNVSDPVEKFIPEFAGLKAPSGRPAHITIEQMLTHTSGLGEGQTAAVKGAHSLRELVPLYLASPMQYEPGERWKYTQSGINVAARIVEVASGMPFDKFVSKRLLKPLGMKNTTFYPSRKQREREATPYVVDKQTGKLTAAPFPKDFGNSGQPPFGNGGLFSTGPDYARFCQMLLNGGTFHGRQYLSAAAFKDLTTVHTGKLETGFLQLEEYGSHGKDYGWGIGVAILKTPHAGVAEMLSPGTFGHGGAWGTQAWIDPVRGLAYILMVQHPGVNGDASKLRQAFQQAASDAFPHR
ncbi:MAG: serine hydrolase domain-containing protein [Acidobacteriaceae bacterium]